LEVLILKIFKGILLFLLGGAGYVAIELLWRGWSHITMFFAGGTCFLLLGGLENAKPRLPLPLRALTGAGIITMVELLFGLLFNRGYSVWDYRSMPGNFHGQICLPFFFVWIPISLVGMLLYRMSDRVFTRWRPSQK
jgi:uncharacterized membrane protein